MSRVVISFGAAMIVVVVGWWGDGDDVGVCHCGGKGRWATFYTCRRVCCLPAQQSITAPPLMLGRFTRFPRVYIGQGSAKFGC